AGLIGLELAGRPNYVGARVARVEDDRLLARRGTFVADLTLPGMVEMAVLRSQVAHARITDIRTAEASAMPGVLSVVTGNDLVDVQPFPDYLDYVRPVAAFPLCRDRIRYV